MPRRPRVAPGGLVYHVLNRAVARLPLFENRADYEAFERVLVLALERHPMRILAYVVMPNHWHMVLWPREKGELTAFVRWLTHTHTMRWHAYHRSTGTGHLYQGRFKAFPVQTDEHFLTVCRYVERNAVRAKLVLQAEQWRWSSLWRRESGDAQSKSLLSDWPVERPDNWLEIINQPQGVAELAVARRSVIRNAPYGSVGWQSQTASRLSLEFTLRPRGRPRKPATEDLTLQK
jgi:putative transposase